MYYITVYTNFDFLLLAQNDVKMAQKWAGQKKLPNNMGKKIQKHRTGHLWYFLSIVCEALATNQVFTSKLWWFWKQQLLGWQTKGNSDSSIIQPSIIKGSNSFKNQVQEKLTEPDL